MNRAGLMALASHWRHRPGQLAALMLGLMLATALWSAVQAINAEARRAYDSAARLLDGQNLARLARTDGLPISVADFAALRRAGYLVSPVIEAQIDGLTVLGVDPLTAPPGMIPDDIITGATDFQAFSGQADLLFVGPNTDAPGFERRTSPALPPGTALADIGTVARLSGQTGASYLIVAPDQPARLASITEATELELQSPANQADLGELTGSFHLNLTAFGLLSFGVGLFIAHSAIGLAIEQRRTMIRTLRALGVPLRRVLGLMAAELLAIALVAGISGIVLGYLVAAGLLPGVAGTLRGLYGAPISGVLAFDPIWAGQALLITLLGAAVAAGGALWRVARMPILAPALPRAWSMRHGRALRIQALAAGLLFALAVLLGAFGQGLGLAFGAVAALLTGSALLLPGALSLGLQVLTPLARGPFAEWLLADTRQQVPGLSLALMALLLALAANIGVSTMVGSFRETFITWLDQRLGSELYVFAQGDPAPLRDFLEPRAEAVLPVMGLDRPILGAPGRLRMLADHATYRDGWPLLAAAPDAWDQLQSGQGVLINEQIAIREGLSLGQSLAITPDLSLPLVGIYADYGNTRGEAIIGEVLFGTLFPRIEPLGFAIRTDPDRVGPLMAELLEFGLPQRAMSDQRAQRALSLTIFERTFQITGALSALTLGVAGLALLIAFLTLAQMRLPQIAPVWTIGATKSRLAWAEFGRALALAALTFLVALPVGLILAWMLLNLVNTQAFGWRLPMLIFPSEWLQLAALSFLAAGLAALWPALRLTRMAPARLLQVFVHER
ncbi:MAG: ABC transporter permease [Pseudomonadota bacterium]